MLACSLAKSALVPDDTRPTSASVLTTLGRLNVTSSVVVTSPWLVFASSRTVHCIKSVPHGQASARPIRPNRASHLPQVFDTPDGVYRTPAWHMLGTCRMGLEPSGSVLNKWHQSWEVPNLYVGDGSSFATGGVVNPTSTVTALALRCARHLAEGFRDLRRATSTCAARRDRSGTRAWPLNGRKVT